MWFTEFGQVAHEAAHLDEAGHLDAAEAALLSGDPVRLLEAFPGGVRIDDPRVGRVEGEAALREFCRLEPRLARRAPGIEPVDRGDDRRERVVGEFDLVARPGRRARSCSRSRSWWSRTPTDAERLDPDLPQPVAAARASRRPAAAARARPGRPTSQTWSAEYQAALAVGDADAITATFEPDGCFREPAGPQFRRCGTDVLLPFF